MEKEIENSFALLGKEISYSFSASYFNDKFQKEGIKNVQYFNIDIPCLNSLPTILNKYPKLKGFNVTIPYKEEIFPFLSEIDPIAQQIQAVNTVKITSNKKLKGYNTDYFGFSESLKPYLKKWHKSALILGTGGASKAVAYALKQLSIPYLMVSRNPKNQCITYHDLNDEVIKTHNIIINCTPLGTYPNINSHPDINYCCLTQKHLLFDLIYNPEKTYFMKMGEKQGATVTNGLKMLILQAEKSWEIWTKKQKIFS